MPRKPAKKKATKPKCKTITFKRGPSTKTASGTKKKGKVLPRSQWKEVTRCGGEGSEGRLSRIATSRWKKQKNKVICRNKKTGVFTRCARAKRRR